MATVGTPLEIKRPANIRGLFSIRFWRGLLVVQAWKKKTGSPKTPYTRGLVSSFRSVIRTVKQVSAWERAALAEGLDQYRRANSGQRGSAIIRERDWLQRVAMGRMYAIDLLDGTTIWPETIARDISDALDILLPVEGSLMVRTSVTWLMTMQKSGDGYLTMTAGEARFGGSDPAGEGNEETTVGGYGP